MFDKILRKIHESIRNSNYIMTLHAEEEMEDDELSIFDIENTILNGKIVEKQKDRLTKEPKYRIKGHSIFNRNVEVIVKINPTGKIVIITVYSIT
jgi:hypothetical protein